MKKIGIFLALVVGLIGIVFSGIVFWVSGDEFEIENFSNENYDNISNITDGVRVVQKNGKEGVINKYQELVLPISYNNIRVIDKKIVAQIGEKISVFDLNGKKILEESGVCIVPNKDIYLELKNDKMGMLDENGKEIVPPLYDIIRYLSNGLAIVKSEGKYGVINKEGKILTPIKYSYIKDYSNGMALVIDENMNGGFINDKGIEVISPKFKYTEDFQKNSTVVLIENKFAVIDKNGNYTIPPQEERINSIGKDLYSVKEGDKFYLKNMYNININNIAYDEIGTVKDGMIAIKIGDKFGYINEKGKNIIKPEYKEIGECLNGIIVAKSEINGKFGLLDYKGKFIVAPKYEYIKDRNKETFIVGNNEGKEGVINKFGKEILPLIYDSVNYLNSKLVLAKKDKEIKIFVLYNKITKELKLNADEKIIRYSSKEIVIKSPQGIKVYTMDDEGIIKHNIDIDIDIILEE